MKGKLIIGKSEQEIFDTVVVHLMAQDGPSWYRVDDGKSSKVCAYRGMDGRKCAAGVLIADDEYTGIEGCSWEDMVSRHNFTGDHMYLIQALQRIHDEDVDSAAIDQHYDEHAWRDRTRVRAMDVAASRNLNTDALERAYKEHT